jgi:hypothetical protein
MIPIIKVENGRMRVELIEIPPPKPKARITKKDGGVFLNGKLIPFVSPNDIAEGDTDPKAIAKMVLKSIKVAEIKGGDSSWQS